MLKCFVCQCIFVLSVLTGLAFAQRPAQRIDDNSDWWSILKRDDFGAGLKPQNREPLSSNYQIAGASIQKEREIVPKFGPVTPVERGDAATGRYQVCYSSRDCNFHMIVEWGEVESVLYLIGRGSDWNGSRYCAYSALVQPTLATGAGIRLGMSRTQVRSILGKPNFSDSNRMVYLFAFKKKPTPQGLKELRAGNSHMSDEEFKRNFEMLDVDSFIEARFTDGKLVYLAIEESEVY